MIIGMIGALISGAVFPVMFYIFGNLTDAMTAYQTSAAAVDGGCNDCIDGESGCPEADAELMDQLLTILWEMCSIGIAMWVGQYVFSVTLNTSAMRQTLRMRKEFLKGTLRQDVGWYDTNTTSDFATKMTEDLNKIQDGIGEKLGMIVRFVITFLGSIAFAFYSNWLISAVLCTIVPIIAVLGGLMGFILTKASNDESKVYAKAGAIAEEALGSIRTVAAFGGEKKEVENYASELKTAKKNGIVRSILTTSSMGLVFAVMYSVQGLGLWYGVKIIKDEEGEDEFQQCAKNCTVGHLDDISELYTCIDEECRRFTIGSITTALFGIVQGGMQIGQAGTYFESFNTARAAAHGIFEVIDRKSPIDSSSTDGTKPQKLNGTISFNNVYFNYPARKEVNILQGLTLEIEKGMTVALVGGSGCGKSTCIQLVQRFYDPDKGTVSIDGTDLKNLNIGWVRDHIGIVGQEPVLFDCSIGENIRYAKPSATFEEIEKACKEANAYAFIQKLPQKYDTMVGEGGTQLSGGQKQRIAIARALIRDPKILLLDEATSALDNESEAIVQDALDRVHAGRTTIVVAHRLTTVRNADLIVALKDGRVAEMGTHDELMERNGLYHSLVESQLAPKGDAEEDDELEDLEEMKRPKSPLERKLSRQMSKQLSRQMSMLPKDEKEALENVVITSGRWTLFSKLLKLNSPETAYLIGGIIAAVGFGCLPPLFGVLFGEFISVFSERDYDTALHDAMIFALEFTAMGVGFFLTLGMQGVMFGIAGENLVERVRKRMLESMLHQEIGWFDQDKNNTGALSSRLSYNAQQVGQATGSKPGQTIGGMTTLVFATGLGLYYNWKLGLVASAFLPPLMFGIMMQLRFMMSESADIKKALESSSKTAVEAISNIRTIFGLRCEELIIAQFSKSLDGPKKNSTLSYQFRAIILGFANSNFFFAYAVVYYYGSHLITHSCPDEFPIDNVFKVAVAVLNGGVFAGIAFQQLLDINKAFAAAETIFEILDRKPAIDSKSSSGKKLDDISGKVTIRNGVFCYPTRSTTKVLRNLTLAIDKGEKIGLVGQSGCGKSTVIQLIQRFYDLDQGVVDIEGNVGQNNENFNIQAINVPFMRSKIGIVSQEPVLFDRSIADNIKYGDNTREVSMEEVIDAAKKSNIHNFVKDLPQGYDTNVGGKGTQLSGGQKQRVAIARALIRYEM